MTAVLLAATRPGCATGLPVFQRAVQAGAPFQGPHRFSTGTLLSQASSTGPLGNRNRRAVSSFFLSRPSVSLSSPGGPTRAARVRVGSAKEDHQCAPGRSSSSGSESALRRRVHSSAAVTHFGIRRQACTPAPKRAYQRSDCGVVLTAMHACTPPAPCTRGCRVCMGVPSVRTSCGVRGRPTPGAVPAGPRRRCPRAATQTCAAEQHKACTLVLHIKEHATPGLQNSDQQKFLPGLQC
jgi:hypothetical protein